MLEEFIINRPLEPLKKILIHIFKAPSLINVQEITNNLPEGPIVSTINK